MGIISPSLIIKSVAAANLFVRDADGDDLNDGLSTGAPLKTLAAALAKLPDFLQNEHIIHLGDGVYPMPEQRQFLLSDRLYFYGDGAGTGDGWTELEASLASLAGSDVDIIVTAGLTPNEHRGKILEITSGAASGAKRMIRDHTATNIFPVRPIPGFNDPDTYRIIEPAVSLRADTSAGGEADYRAFQGVGGRYRFDDGSTKDPAIVFAQLKLTAQVSRTVGFTDATYAFYAVEVDGTGVTFDLFWADADVWAGTDSLDGELANLATPLAGAPLDWLGCGLSRVDDNSGSIFRMENSKMRGFFVTEKSLLDGEFGLLHMFGGNLFGAAGAKSLDIRRHNYVILDGQDDNSDTLLIASTDGNAIIADNGAEIDVLAATVNSTTGTTIRVLHDARLTASGLFGESASGLSLDASLGGKAFMKGGPNFGRAAGLDYRAEAAGVLDKNKSFFASVGDGIAGEGSVIVKTL